MSRYHDWYPPYVSTAEKQYRNEKMAAKLSKEGRVLKPILVKGRKMATSFWGKAWCDNVESYQDYSNRLPRGRSYVRNGAVLDLDISTGKVTALVSGSSSKPYEISITISPLAPERWELLKKKCLGKISSLLALVQGKLPQEILAEFCNRETGLFPSPKEIKTSCSCPDWAGLCKHLAAVLYGIGVRLDEDPKLFFTLRGVKESDLVGSEVIDTLTEGVSSEIASDDLSSVFDMELDSLGEPGAANTGALVRQSKETVLSGHPWPGSRVRALRKELKLIQAAFGELFQVTPGMVSCWEHGKTVVKPCYWNKLEELQPEKEAAPPEEPVKPKPPEEPAKQVWGAKQIQKLRKKLKLTQAALGKLLRVTSTTVSNWECGRAPVARSHWKKLESLATKKK
jgi:uncharacterized Zn finger protein/transcriptional regulator with XRE-family HTH domain